MTVWTAQIYTDTSAIGGRTIVYYKDGKEFYREDAYGFTRRLSSAESRARKKLAAFKCLEDNWECVSEVSL